MTFFPGMRRVAGSGRKPGTPNRGTELMRKRVQSATATFRDSPQLVQEVANFLRGVATARTAGMTPEPIAALPREELLLLQTFLTEAAHISLKAMEFSHPKPARIDAPMINVANRTMVVELKLGAGASPTLPNAQMIEHEGAAAPLPRPESGGDSSP